MYKRLARWAFSHPAPVFAAWIVTLFGVLALAGTIGDQFDDGIEIPGSDTEAGFDILDEHFGGVGSGAEGFVVIAADRPVTDPSVQGPIEGLLAEVEEIDGVTVRSPYAPGGAQQISALGADAGRIAYASLALDAELNQTEASETGVEILELLRDNEIPGVQLEVGGAALAEFEPPETELIGLAFAVIVLILAMGSVLAMGITIGVALFGVGTGVGLIILISNVITAPDFAVTIGAMIGLGVGIDYALFIVTRYRESIRQGFVPIDATAIALDTAGRSVIFAGATVVVSLLGLLLIGLEFIAGLGIGAAATVLMTMIASVTLLPASLGLAGDRVEVTRRRGIAMAGFASLALLALGLSIPPLALVGAAGLLMVLLVSFAYAPLRKAVPPRVEKPLRTTFWYRWSRMIQARPWSAALAGFLILGVMTLPVLDLRLGFSDESNFPEGSTTREAYELISDGFGPGFNGPLLLVTEVSGSQDLADAAALAASLETVDGVASVTGPIPNDQTDPTAAIVQVIPSTSPQDEDTEALVVELRDDVIPAATDGTELVVFVTGQVAANIDISDLLAGRTLLFFSVVLALSFLLLMMVFRSLLVPLKAVIMNMMSIGAAYGLIVAVFSWGWGAGLFDTSGGPIEPFIPMMLFAIVFGLSMDYEVFLLSRIKEEYEHTGDAVESVADGLAATARVITAAAAIMVVVFGSFVLEDNRVIKLFGMGLAAAVALDASFVRMLLVPATMELLGDRNWWLPAWLDRILPDLNVEGSRPAPPAVPGTPIDWDGPESGDEVEREPVLV
ncbi:MAG: MMPL family transporter [Actinomycetota bacterium]